MEEEIERKRWSRMRGGGDRSEAGGSGKGERKRGMEKEIKKERRIVECLLGIYAIDFLIICYE